MRNLLFALAFLLPAAGCNSGGQTEAPQPPTELSNLIDQLKAAHAPDKRVALFDIRAEQQDGQWLLTGETNLPNAKKALESEAEALGYATAVQQLPDEGLEGLHYGIVNLSACNIRSKPGHSSELSTQSTLGTLLNVLKKEDGWYLVQTPDGYLGWLDSGGFELTDKAGADTWVNNERVIYLPDFGFSYSSPGGSGIVSDLVAGNILRKLGQEGGFTKVQYPDGREAYIMADEAMDYQAWLDSRSPTAENILRTASRFMGRPYLWGGTSGKGVDCSGFTKTVFYLNGLMLPRDASQQVHTGVEVETDTTFSNLLPGDLLFFGRKATAEKPEKITHVAIYQGDGAIIHASGQVREESLRRGDSTFTEYRLTSFVRAKRMLVDQPTEYGILPLAEVPGY
jgi:hypothetical protein